MTSQRLWLSETWKYTEVGKLLKELHGAAAHITAIFIRDAMRTCKLPFYRDAKPRAIYCKIMSFLEICIFLFEYKHRGRQLRPVLLSALL
jgi:hypothetical protein